MSSDLCVKKAVAENRTRYYCPVRLGWSLAHMAYVAAMPFGYPLRQEWGMWYVSSARQPRIRAEDALLVKRS
jgi:hypothetical protein